MLNAGLDEAQAGIEIARRGEDATRGPEQRQVRTRGAGRCRHLVLLPLGATCAEVTPTLVPDCPPHFFFFLMLTFSSKISLKYLSWFI